MWDAERREGGRSEERRAGRVRRKECDEGGDDRRRMRRVQYHGCFILLRWGGCEKKLKSTPLTRTQVEGIVWGIEPPSYTHHRPFPVCLSSLTSSSSFNHLLCFGRRGLRGIREKKRIERDSTERRMREREREKTRCKEEEGREARWVRGRGCALRDLHMRILYFIYCVDHPPLYLLACGLRRRAQRGRRRGRRSWWGKEEEREGGRNRWWDVFFHRLARSCRR